ncbi:MAG: M16 family metallopeptidase, partial [Acidimicrobiales bacterium]
GTPKRSARAIAESVDAVGGDMNAFTTKEYTAFYIRLLSEHVDLGLDLLCDVMWSPAFRPDEVEAERQVILEEIAMRGDEPADLVHECFAAAQFPRHPLGREVVGEPGTIGAMSSEDIRAFFSHHYRPGNMVVSVAGDLEHESIAKGIEARFAGSSGGAAPVRHPPTDDPLTLSVTRRPTEQAHLVLGAPAPSRHDQRRWSLAVLNHALGGGLSSRLFQEIRERRGLAYSVYSERVGYDDTGSLCVYAGTSPERAHQVVGLINHELDRLGEGITSQELELAKGHLRAQTLLSLEDSGARMGRIGRSMLLHGELLTVEDVLSRIASVGLEDVREIARSIMSAPRTLAVVGPFDSDDLSLTAR